MDVSYINICGTFYYLCSVLDGHEPAIFADRDRKLAKARDRRTATRKAARLAVA